MTSPDEMKAREIANALRVNASTTGADAEEELIAAITQALSEKTAEIERRGLEAHQQRERADRNEQEARAEAAAVEIERLKLDVAHVARRCLDAEARLSEVVGECVKIVEDYDGLGVLASMYEQGGSASITQSEIADAIRARFQNGGKP